MNNNQRILIVDDDRLFSDVLRTELARTGLPISAAATVREGRMLCRQTGFEIVLLDSNLPDGSGLDLIEDVLSVNDRAKIILVTAFPNYEHAVRALKKGAYDYISKPVDLDELHATIGRARRASNLEALEQAADYQNDRDRQESVLIGSSDAFTDVRDLVARAAVTGAPVLITGETGTGKNVVAKMIHHQSARRRQPLISLNCAALPESLIEAELFGVEKGAYTGAVQTRKGIFELADGGTLFLDEIGEMPFALQAKLLSALEDRKIRRIGSDRVRPIDVRIIAATNAVPETAIREKRFREDLFYRLSVIHIRLPPLREHRPDVADLCRYFVEKFAPARQIEIPAAEIEKLEKYDFPGNTRELRNIIERCLILQEGNAIYPSKLINSENSANGNGHAPATQPQAFLPANLPPNLPLAEVERQYILDIYRQHQNNLAHTSSALEISLSTLKRKLREYGLR